MKSISIGIGMVAALALAACGGGGSGVMSDGSATPGASSAPASLTSSDVRTADVNEILDSARRAVSSGPTFGSVVQSTGGNASGISSTFDGQALTVAISRQGADTIALNTADTIIDSGNVNSLVGLEGRSSRSRGVFSYTSSSATLAEIAVDWKNSDPTDYLAGGYWLHIDGDIAAGTVSAVEIGAFIDAPELSLSDPPNLPIQGTASYRGAAAGLYAAEYGTDADGPAGSTEIGEFSGIATLSADFGARTINGCVGCEGSIDLSGVYQNSATGAVSSFSNVPTDYRVHLGAAPIDSNAGTFVSHGVTLSSTAVPVASSSGAWGGQFSNIPDATGDPRLVAGTFGGEATTAGGSQAVFVGAFGAGKR